MLLLSPLNILGVLTVKKQRVRVLVSIASPSWSYMQGDIAELDAAEAERWIKAGIAVPLGEEIETATAEPPENTMKPVPKKRKAGRKAGK